MNKMILTPTQAKVAEDRHRFRVINCGRRWGKTTLAIEEIKGKAVYNPSRITYIAPTYQQARDIAWKMLVSELQPIILKVNESRLELTVRTVDSKESFIALRGWESIETLRGQQYDLIVIDEIASMRNFWSNWQEIVRPTLTDTRGEAIFISTPKGFNHFYDLYNLENKDSDYKSFHYTSYDNPHIPKDELDKAKEEITEDRFAQEYMADFRKTEGLVYKEFNREEHLFNNPGFEDEEFRTVKVFGGVDYGFTNPCAVIEIKKDKDANYWVMFEWYKTQQTDAQIAQYVSALKWNECYPDPESPSGIKELVNKGVNVREVIKGKDSIRNGINVVRELFKANRLYIHKSCENLIWELETYSYPEKKPDRNEDENPIKDNDHALDALRYALSMESSTKTKSVNIYRPQVNRTNVGWANKFT
jgi:PBSX family phage terminase large subunit